MEQIVPVIHEGHQGVVQLADLAIEIADETLQFQAGDLRGCRVVVIEPRVVDSKLHTSA